MWTREASLLSILRPSQSVSFGAFHCTCVCCMNTRSIIDKYLVYQDRNVGNNHSYLIQQNNAMQPKWATVLTNQQAFFYTKFLNKATKRLLLKYKRFIMPCSAHSCSVTHWLFKPIKRQFSCTCNYLTIAWKLSKRMFG